MKLVIRTFIFHTLCIILFAFIYLYLSDHFHESDSRKNPSKKLIDFFLLSTTIQAGVGISELLPSSYYGKLVVIIQQIIMLFAHIITIYIFTL